MKDWGESVSELMIKQNNYKKLYCLTWVFLPLYMFYSNLSPAVLLLVISCVVCNCCWLAVCIVVVVLCVLLSSSAYLLHYVGIAFFFLL